ncbi:hypothetical protein ASALC70_03739 [Alcanivorax sp. ALC70]|nr:hypothetical protein ASALC70_03739 [Alcanivorax sp. ALC70]
MPNRFAKRNRMAARLLGIGGLIPFYFCALLTWVETTRVWALDAVTGYAAVILAFLGAVHWGGRWPNWTGAITSARWCSASCRR